MRIAKLSPSGLRRIHRSSGVGPARQTALIARRPLSASGAILPKHGSLKKGKLLPSNAHARRLMKFAAERRNHFCMEFASADWRLEPG